ncbi:Arm DNA-binding domain-containing protein [Bartonella harrusi]|uniref:Arm DNA-binding domain-containing protein n=1 Tax=Bartonella harrusi TaxID=2961895 RepID=A0ABY5ERF2_9HYPH|nr:Arm DNA-binding domain-containing protein [Bartonella harrusi]
MGANKEYDGASLYLHKRKDGCAQWLYRYTIHGHHHEMGFGALRNVLKQARELATQWRSVLHEGRSVLHEGRASIKEHDKQKREAMRNLHYLKRHLCKVSCSVLTENLMLTLF